MAVNTITYANKVNLNENSGIAEINKITDANMNEIKSVVNNNATELSNLQGTILWTNSSPTSSFAAQSITLSSGDYDVLEIFYVDYTQNGRIMSQRAIKGKDALLNSLFYISNNMYMGARAITYVSATSLSVEACKKIIDNSVIITPANSNSWLVPQYIIGYKTGLF